MLFLSMSTWLSIFIMDWCMHVEAEMCHIFLCMPNASMLLQYYRQEYPTCHLEIRWHSLNDNGFSSTLLNEYLQSWVIIPPVFIFGYARVKIVITDLPTLVVYDNEQELKIFIQWLVKKINRLRGLRQVFTLDPMQKKRNVELNIFRYEL